MSDGTGIVVLIAIIWIGWPLHSIARDFKALLKLATKS